MKILRENKIVLFFYMTILSIGLYFYSSFPKGHEILFFYDLHDHHVLNSFFKFITHFGEFLWILPICWWMYHSDRAHFKPLIAALILNQLITHSIKWVINNPRPLVYFENLKLQMIEGVHPLYHYSFPSGHTSMAFCMCVYLSLVCKSNWLKFLTISLALLVAISRMYLTCHFLEDVLVGSFIGTASALIVKAIDEHKVINKR
jgi:membrane-associated phospholipid phosphatase